jgi:hypothetical protein
MSGNAAARTGLAAVVMPARPASPGQRRLAPRVVDPPPPMLLVTSATAAAATGCL